jgi:predicted Zn-dependent protease
MVTFMQKLMKLGGSSPTFLSTHPATSDRIKALQEKIDPQTAKIGDGLNRQYYKNNTSSL